MAKLYFYYGAMNSGKTTRLLQTAHNYEQKGRKVLIVKPGIDTKGKDQVLSRLGAARKVDVLIDKHASIYDTVKELTATDSIDVILIDEVQFLTAQQIDECMAITAFDGIPVLCYGLRADFLNRGFEGSTRLLQIAHEIEELKTICACGAKATVNVRLDNDGNIIRKGEQIVIEGDANYDAMCFKCAYS